MELYGGNDYRDYLAHYGVVGMRWGIRRYQPYSYTGARKDGKTGKEIGAAARLARGAAKAAGKGVAVAGRVGIKGAKAVGRASVKGAKAAGARHKAYKTKKEEQAKKRLIEFGTPKEILANRGRLSEAEIEMAIKRLNNDVKLRDIDENEFRRRIKRGQQAINDVSTFVKTVSGVIDTVGKINEKLGDPGNPHVSSQLSKAIDTAMRDGNWDFVLQNRASTTEAQRKRAMELKKFENTISGKDQNNGNKNNDDEERDKK